MTPSGRRAAIWVMVGGLLAATLTSCGQSDPSLPGPPAVTSPAPRSTIPTTPSPATGSGRDPSSTTPASGGSSGSPSTPTNTATDTSTGTPSADDTSAGRRGEIGKSQPVSISLDTTRRGSKSAPVYVVEPGQRVAITVVMTTTSRGDEAVTLTTIVDCGGTTTKGTSEEVTVPGSTDGNPTTVVYRWKANVTIPASCESLNVPSVPDGTVSVEVSLNGENPWGAILANIQIKT